MYATHPESTEKLTFSIKTIHKTLYSDKVKFSLTWECFFLKKIIQVLESQEVDEIPFVIFMNMVKHSLYKYSPSHNSNSMSETIDFLEWERQKKPRKLWKKNRESKFSFFIESKIRTKNWEKNVWILRHIFFLYFWNLQSIESG